MDVQDWVIPTNQHHGVNRTVLWVKNSETKRVSCFADARAADGQESAHRIHCFVGVNGLGWRTTLGSTTFKGVKGGNLRGEIAHDPNAIIALDWRRGISGVIFGLGDASMLLARMVWT